MKQQFILAADPTVCSGCRICELVCSFTNEGVFNSEKSRIHVVRVGPPALDFPIACRHCTKAVCADFCPPGAIFRDRKGITRIIEEKCTGCSICVQVCPIGAVRMHPDKGVPLICDLCGQCVGCCPTRTLKIIQPNRQAEENAWYYALFKLSDIKSAKGLTCITFNT